MGELFESGEPWFAAAETLLVGVAVALAVGIGLRLLTRRLLRDEGRAQRTAMLAFWGIVVIFGLVAVTRLAGGAGAEAGLSAASDRLFATLPDLVVALVIILIGTVLATAARTTILRLLAQGRPRFADPLATAAATVVVLIAVLLAARQVGIATALADGVVLALVSAGLLAVALAAGLGGREIAGAYAAGRHALDILTVGDVVEVDGRRGRVLRLGSTSVRLGLDDGAIAEIPNPMLLTGTVLVFQHEEEPARDGTEAAPPRGDDPSTAVVEVDDEAPTRAFASADGPVSDAGGSAADAEEAADGEDRSVARPDPTRSLEPGWRQRAEAARAAIARAEAEHAGGRSVVRDDDDDGPPTQAFEAP